MRNTSKRKITNKLRPDAKSYEALQSTLLVSDLNNSAQNIVN